MIYNLPIIIEKLSFAIYTFTVSVILRDPNVLRSYLKKRILVQIQGGAEFPSIAG